MGRGEEGKGQYQINPKWKYWKSFKWEMTSLSLVMIFINLLVGGCEEFFEEIAFLLYFECQSSSTYCLYKIFNFGEGIKA